MLIVVHAIVIELEWAFCAVDGIAVRRGRRGVTSGPTDRHCFGCRKVADPVRSTVEGEREGEGEGDRRQPGAHWALALEGGRGSSGSNSAELSDSCVGPVLLSLNQ